MSAVPAIFSRDSIVVIQLPPPLESALAALAKQRGVSPDALALAALRREFLPPTLPAPADDWERLLFSAAVDCGVSVSDAALSSDGLYES